jgi:hypothetical protein
VARVRMKFHQSPTRDLLKRNKSHGASIGDSSVLVGSKGGYLVRPSIRLQISRLKNSTYSHIHNAYRIRLFG